MQGVYNVLENRVKEIDVDIVIIILIEKRIQNRILVNTQNVYRN